MVLGVLAGPVAAADVVNAAPVANPDSATTTVGVAVVVDPRANDTDPDSDSVTVTGVTLRSGTATVTLDPASQLVSILPTRVSPVVVDYAILDARGAVAQGVITVSVNPAPNRAPVAVADVGQMVIGGELRIDPRRNDSDPDGEPLSLTSASITAGVGSVAIEGQELVIRGGSGFIGPLVVAYVVSDPRGGRAESTVTVTVTARPNRPPVAVGDSVTVRNGRTYRIRVLANDTDPDGDRIRLVKVGKAKHGKVRKSGSKVVYTAPKSWTGRVSVTYTIKDKHGLSDKGVLTIVVRKGAPTPKPTPAPSGRRAVEAALARLGLPTGSVNGTFDARTRRALCAWRTVTGNPAHRGLPTAGEAKAIVAMSDLPRARASMVVGVNVSVTCQAAFWVGADREYRRVMAASTGKPGYRTRLGIHRIFRTHHVWRYSTIYPEARMYKPMQFSGGQAMHGSSTDRLVKTYPASHGCVRMLHRDIDAMQAGGVGNGTRVRVFGAW
jgi:lipoprotein-anchoring transpeptidase ErfK/SrfK